ncbi:hypothetical protein FQA39_LY00995 [Lamprigera yunnana]|nr:hypothetical protein FQA39_LY00995 [Lamprigera yunnana]
MVRHKQRYMVVQIIPQQFREGSSFTLHSFALHQAILSKVQLLHGDFGCAAITAGFAVKYFNEKTTIAIVRSRHGPHNLITSVLPLIRSVDKKSVVLNNLYTGATLKQCFKYILHYQVEKVNEMYATLQTEQEKEDLKEALINCKLHKLTKLG